MQSMTFRDGKLVPKHSGKAFLMRILSAHLRGLTPDEFADEEWARMQAERGATRDEPKMPACAVCGEQADNQYGDHHLCNQCKADVERVQAKYRWPHNEVVERLQLVAEAETARGA